MGPIGDLDKRLSASAATSPSAITEFAGEYFDLYNDLHAAKNELLAADPGGKQKQALAEFGAGLVRLPYFELCCFFILFYFRKNLDLF